MKGYAEAKRIEEVLFAIARLAKMSVGSVERLIMRPWSSPVGALLKEINFNLATHRLDLFSAPLTWWVIGR